MIENIEARAHELAEALETWQQRVDHLKGMAVQVSNAASSRYDEIIRRMRKVLKDVRQLLSRSASMTPEQWIDARTEILAGFQVLQQEYNAAAADWPQE